MTVPLPMPFHRLPAGSPATVVSVDPPPHAPHWAGMLEELGFVPGEPVSVLARAALGGGAIVARVGVSTFALRAAEAGCVWVLPDLPRPA